MNEATEKPFWFVWNKNGNNPSYEHQSELSATTEAERLARQYVGQTFVVLKAIAARKVDNMQRITFNDDSDLPF